MARLQVRRQAQNDDNLRSNSLYPYPNPLIGQITARKASANFALLATDRRWSTEHDVLTTTCRVI